MGTGHQIYNYKNIRSSIKAYLDEVWEIEGWLFNPPLSLEVLPLEAPVPGDRYRVPSRLEGSNKYNTVMCTLDQNVDLY